jgi:NADH dehydrogenase
MATSARRILVLGAGYGGLRAALDLALGNRRHGLGAQVTLLDRSPHHQLITRLHRVATGGESARSAQLPIASLLPAGAVEILCGEVERIDPEGRFVEAGDLALSYDQLVIALGSEAAAPPIPGLEEFGFSLRWLQDALRLRQHLRAVFAQAGRSADGAERRRLLRVAVVGGGATGCQLAGELAHWVTDLADEYGAPLAEIHLLLLEAQGSLMAGSGERTSDQALAVLQRKGVDVRLQCAPTAISQDRLSLPGEELPCATVLWAGGIRAPSLLAESGLATGPGGRLRVDRHLRVEGHDEHWAVGDCCTFEHEGQPLPATAAIALRQGAYVATACLEILQGRSPKVYRPRNPGLLVSLGGDEAVGHVLGMPLEGKSAGLVKESIERWYQVTVSRRLPLLDL